MAKSLWHHDGGSMDGKRITIVGPGTLSLSIDNDDVDCDEVEVAVPEIVDALNAHWAARANAINRATQMVKRMARAIEVCHDGDEEGRDPIEVIEKILLGKTI